MVVNGYVEGGVAYQLGSYKVVKIEGLFDPLDQPCVGLLQPGGEDRDRVFLRTGL